jgi:hypothetical protein
MLKFSIKLNNKTYKEPIILKSLYVSPDLQFISGITDSHYDLSEGEVVEISSTTTPQIMKLKLEDVQTFANRGYIQYTNYVPVNKVINYTNMGDGKTSAETVNYIWHNGNVYYSYPYSGGTNAYFNIGSDFYTTISGTSGQTYCVIDNEKALLEDNQAVISGKTYTVRFFDQSGKQSGDTEIIKPTESLAYYSDDMTVVDGYDSNKKVKAQKLTKFTIRNATSWNLDLDDFYMGRYLPYIIYSGETMHFEEYYETKGDNAYMKGFGVVINGIFYNSSVYFDTDAGKYIASPYGYGEGGTNNPVITINGEDFPIFFEFRQTPYSDIAAISTKEENPAIMINDIIMAKNSNDDVIYRVTEENYDYETLESSSSGQTLLKFIYHQGIRYDVVKNLADKLVINDFEYPITYFPNVDSRFLKAGNMGYASVNEEKFYFKVKRTVGGKTTCIKQYYDGSGKTYNAYTMVSGSNNTTTYTDQTPYTIKHYDGVKINDTVYTVYSAYSGSDDSIYLYSYVQINEPVEYKLKVIDVIGSKIFVCTPYFDARKYSQSAMDAFREEMMSVLVNNYETMAFSVKNLLFGYDEITPYTYSEEAVFNNHPVSSEDFFRLINNMTIFKIHDYMTFPLKMDRKVQNDLYKAELTEVDFYNDTVSNSINKIVDMDKDVYFPSILTTDNKDGTYIFSDVSEIEINMHFRTRDLNSWKIIEDYGDANHLFSNWFIFDYEPYTTLLGNQSTSKSDLMSASDLIGLMYYTTDDVYYEKTKLSKSFLRISYYDSMDSQNQNLLGTSTIFIDGHELHKKYNSLSDEGISFKLINQFMIVTSATTVGVMTEPYQNAGYTLDDENRLSSRLTILPKETTKTSSEGFYAYFFKEYADSLKSKEIYLKFEFFHAGVGRRIPLIIPTTEDNNTFSTITGWTDSEIADFKKGYSIQGIQDRLYMPMYCKYDISSKKYRYYLHGTNYHNSYFIDSEKKKLKFNLFELKIKNEDNT